MNNSDNKKEYLWHHENADNSFNYLSKSINKIIEKFIEKSNLLDIGCGNGFLTKSLSKNFKSVTAIDNSISAIDQAKKNYTGNIKFLNGDLKNLKIDKKFNCITLIEVLEHLYSPDDMLKNIYEISDENTNIILSTPYHNFIKNLLILFSGKFDDHFSPLWEHGHIKFFSKKTLVEICKRNNFKIEKVFYSGRFFPISKSIIFIIKKK